MSKKSLLFGVMFIILLCLGYSIATRILIGQVLCLGATAGLFIVTNKRHIQK